MPLTAVSAFAGVGGIDLALERSGIRTTAAIEVDPRARGVLRRHFPNTALFGDIREVSGEQLLSTGFNPAAGVLAGGWPCQGLSVAGLRRGLDDHRSGLFYELARLAAELRPQWLLLENVPGLLSSNQGADMGRVLQELVGLGYGMAWRVVDAQGVGLAQRRRRVLFVGRLGDWAGPSQVLLECEGSGWDPAARRAARAQAAAPASGSAAHGSRGYGLAAAAPDVAGPLAANQGGHRCDLDGSGAYVTGALGELAHTLTAEGHDASEDGTGRGTPVVAYPVAIRGREGGTTLEAGPPGGPAFALRAASGGASAAMIAVGTITARYGGGLDSSCYSPLVQEDMTVRKLTPRECERLQGFPDDWTLYSDGHLQSDSARYRQLGNAAPPPLIEWPARRIAAFDQQPAITQQRGE
ncbi:DNA (cytosine-5-)-methyltransferase [Nonomuraea sp. NBC_01738]|uniref:DNA cytosine methyltransferase n=1 Tax=Nonomuraea sp. NBC_01738 TaxID=2976003 RepID=UPI002E0D6DC6|nr:DNA (cytosine-5-)-methyltransferase [Nonomuraea sp. NBC_01738]